jgi:ATP-dependent RNA helicase DDX10/DBP4
MDGLGAVVIVPVRELAIQVFEVLNSFTEKMEISVGLIIGGKDVKYEQDRIRLMNILVCTPGRFLQHL